ncbi:isoform 2 of ankyrin repeat-containing protein npr4, partial [Fagus crenata]
MRIISCIGWPSIKRLWKMKMNHISALTVLIELLVKADSTWASSFTVEEKTISLEHGVVQFKQGNEKLSNTIEGGDSRTEGKLCDYEKLYKTPDTPLLIAARHGIEEIFDKIIDLHPQAIEHINKDEGNILHFAIAHRQRSIFRRVKQMKVVMQCRLVSRIDMNGYTLLHQAADMKYYKPTKPGPVYQLQEELKWLETLLGLGRDKNGLTADELFKEEHAQLLGKAQTWIKETSQSCSAVAVLVATVVFAAAYTVPGGNDANGHPNFIKSPFFSFFTVMDSISLASSLTSVVMFLSILSSPFEQEYFHKTLPWKLIIGFSLLFFSVTTTILSFVATIILIFHFEKRTWTNTLIYTAAFLPVCMFALMQFPMFASFANCLTLLIKKVVKK